MEGEGSPNPSYPKHSKTSSVKLVQTLGSGSSSKLPLRPLASTRSMPSPALLVAANQNGASSNTRSRNKSKVAEDSSNNNGGQTGDTSCDGQGDARAPREQDMRFLPITNVLRIMRKMLPTHAKISDDAKEATQECVSEFISFITSEANERCRQEQRKTITAEDILWSMCKLGFAEYIEPLSLYLQRYREAEGEVRCSLRGDLLPTIKRTASDAGLYGYVQQQPPQYRFMQTQGHYHNPIAFNLPQYPYLQQPQAFLPGGGGSSFAAMEQGLLPSSPPPMVQYCNRPEAPAYHDMQPPPAGASSSQAADPSQQPFPSFDPYTPNK